MCIFTGMSSRTPSNPVVARVEVFDDSTFILLKGLDTLSDEFAFKTMQLGLFLGRCFVVTRHPGHSPSIDLLRQEVERNKGLVAGGPDALTLRLFRIMVDRYTRKLLALEPRLDDIERKFRRVLRYHIQVFSEFMNDPPPHVDPKRRHEIQDVYEHQERASSPAANLVSRAPRPHISY